MNNCTPLYIHPPDRMGCLQEWRRTLTDKVRAQIDPVEGVTRLVRYLSSQIAKAVLDSDNENLLS